LGKTRRSHEDEGRQLVVRDEPCSILWTNKFRDVDIILRNGRKTIRTEADKTFNQADEAVLSSEPGQWYIRRERERG
jgi:hypothetical protein